MEMERCKRRIRRKKRMLERKRRKGNRENTEEGGKGQGEALYSLNESGFVCFLSLEGKQGQRREESGRQGDGVASIY